MPRTTKKPCKSKMSHTGLCNRCNRNMRLNWNDDAQMCVCSQCDDKITEQVKIDHPHI